MKDKIKELFTAEYDCDCCGQPGHFHEMVFHITKGIFHPKCYTKILKR